MSADPRPAKRMVDPEAIARKVNLDIECRACGQPGHDTHHLIPRGEQGDDEMDNIVVLCIDCHRDVHAEDPQTWARLIANLSPRERAYCEQKSPGYLDRRIERR